MKRPEKPIAYVEHPLSMADKFEITSKGFTVVDLEFKPEEIGKNDKVITKGKKK